MQKVVDPRDVLPYVMLSTRSSIQGLFAGKDTANSSNDNQTTPPKPPNAIQTNSTGELANTPILIQVVLTLPKVPLASAQSVCMSIDCKAWLSDSYCSLYSVVGTDEGDETAQSSGSRFPISKDDAVTIAIALAVSTLVRTCVTLLLGCMQIWHTYTAAVFCAR